MCITFNDDQLGAPELKYVLWVDIMGIKEKMSRSLHQSANFIGKFHSVVSSCGGPGITIYPVMDGAYVTFDDQEKAESNVKDCIVKVYTELLHEFVGEKELLHRFLIRGGLAYGPVYPGTRLNKSVVPSFYQDPSVLLLGFPVVQAHICESHAAPFGVCVDDSVLSKSCLKAKPTFSGRWFHWEHKSSPSDIKAMRQSLKNHYQECEAHRTEIGYDDEALARHRMWAYDFWGIK